VRPLPPNHIFAGLYNILIPKQTDLPISYNIAPSQKVLTIRFSPKAQQRSLVRDSMTGLILDVSRLTTPNPQRL
jgi:hypothetical protein